VKAVIVFDLPFFVAGNKPSKVGGKETCVSLLVPARFCHALRTKHFFFAYNQSIKVGESETPAFVLKDGESETPAFVLKDGESETPAFVLKDGESETPAFVTSTCTFFFLKFSACGEGFFFSCSQ
jgi:hypothetical protein